MSTNDIPDWAIERAFRLSGYQHTRPAEFRNGSLVSGYDYFAAFARYIAEHEEAPVDPDLIEARATVEAAVGSQWPAHWGVHEDIANGTGLPDDVGCEAKRLVVVALASIKRGRELAEASK